MSNLLNPKDIVSIKKDIRDLFEPFARLEVFYLVTETAASTSGNPIESVFGEPLNPFETVSPTRTLQRFEGKRLSDSTKFSYLEAGATSKPSFLIEVPIETQTLQRVSWDFGAKVLYNGEDYRVVSYDPRGMVNNNRIVLRLEKVT
jgi:hypothetical protein